MKLIYLGTNTLVFRKDQSALLVDPHFTRPGLLALLRRLHPDPKRVAAGLGTARISRLDAVLLTHTHYDHALDLPEIVRTAGGQVFGSESAANILRGSGMRSDAFHRVMPGEAYLIGNATVRFHPAQHISFPPPLSWLMPENGAITAPLQPPGYFWAYRCGAVYAIQIDQVLVFGSAGFVPGAYAGLDVQDVVLGVGGLATKPAAYLRQFYQESVLSVGAKRVWLSHWDHFFLPVQRGLRHLALSGRTVRRIQALGKHYGQDVKELQFGQAVDVGQIGTAQ